MTQQKRKRPREQEKRQQASLKSARRRLKATVLGYHKTLKALKADNFILYKRNQGTKDILCKYLSVDVSLLSFKHYGSDKVLVIGKFDILTRDFTILDINENSPVEDMVRYIGRHKALDTLIKEKLEQRRTTNAL